MDNLIKRKKAIEKHLEGVSLFDIMAELKVSERWFYKWLKRYRGDPNGLWYEEQSKRPKTSSSKYRDVQVEQVKAVRAELLSVKYAQVGAVNIQYKLQERGYELIPVWAINRILKRENLIGKPLKEKRQNIAYPGDKYLNVHQMDIVGPRYIKDYGRIYFLNLMDVECRYACITPLDSKQAEGVLEAIQRFWKQVGPPDFLQMDNELCFRGSNRYPRSYGKIIRYTLLQGVTPIFIPCAEPWRNGVIEKFNDTFDKRFFRQEKFIDLEDTENKSVAFEDFHNQNHRYSMLSQRTPQKAMAEKPFLLALKDNIDIKESLPLSNGRIIIIRFIRSDLTLDIFGEKFKVPAHLQYSYVECIIEIENDQLLIIRDGKIEKIIAYPITRK